MPPFKEKLGMRMQKVQNIFRPSKRRIAEEDASNQPPKQLRTTLTKNDTSVQSPLFRTPPSTSGSSSSTAKKKTTGTLSSGVKTFHGFPAMPSIGDTEPPAGSSKENPIDLDGPTPSHAFHHSSTQALPIRESSSSLILLEDDDSQVVNDEAIARLLQEEEHDFHEQPQPSQEHFLPLTEEETQKQIEELRAKYHRKTCRKCRNVTEMTADSLVQRTRSMLKQGRIHPFTKCSICNFEDCMACGTQSKYLTEENNTIRTTADGIRGLWCCPEGHAFVIFSLLCGCERPTAATTATAASGPPQRQQQQPPNQQKTTAFAKGTGYGGSDTGSLFKQANKPKIESKETISYFLTLAEFLPSVERRQFATMPGLRVMIHKSPMVRLACEILRSAAIEEMDQRADIIRAALSFVESLSRNWDVASSIFHEQILFPPSGQLLLATLPPKRQVKSSEKAVPETAQSIYTVVERLAVTCRVFVQGSKNFTGDGGEAIGIALQVCDLQDSLDQLKPDPECESQQLEPVLPSPSKGAVVTRSKGKELDLMAATAQMAEYHKKYSVRGIDNDILMANFFFRPAETQSSAARMRKLFMQISSLHTDLPDGIYVRYGESRPDMLKILIIGPKNTPYEHGIFLFDIFCNQNFPEKPPKVQYLTTGGGRARFNPNLYNNGTVCLSLLGTWNGPSWIPDKSTILQILVSVQSMIFVEHPFFNEPGFEQRYNLVQSESYNREKEGLTLQYAINPWLAVLDKAWRPQPSDLVTLADCNVWGDVVLKHFELKGPAILAKVQEWQKKPDTHIQPGTVTWLESALKKPLAVPTATGEAGQSNATLKPSAT